MALELGLTLKNELLNGTYKDKGVSFLIYGSEELGGTQNTTIKTVGYNIASASYTEVAGIVRLEVNIGEIVNYIIIENSNGDIYDKIKLEGAEIGNFTTQLGTYQINLLRVGI